MKEFFLTSVIIALFTIVCWSCSNNEFEEIQNPETAINETTTFSRSAGTIDYSQFTLLENRYVMPRTGEAYQGTVTYMDTGFPVYIYWDFDFEDYNLFAYINGINPAGYLVWVGDSWTPDNYWDYAGYYEKVYQLSHVASYEAGSNSSRFDFVIKCNFSEYVSNGYHPGDWTNYRHVSFHVIFYPETRNCSFEIIEDGEDWWGDPDRED